MSFITQKIVHNKKDKKVYAVILCANTKMIFLFDILINNKGDFSN
jgi:hypothetical protein